MGSVVEAFVCANPDEKIVGQRTRRAERRERERERDRDVNTAWCRDTYRGESDTGEETETRRERGRKTEGREIERNV